jgi:hypothetical protein
MKPPKDYAEELVDKFHIKVYVSFIENSIPSVINALVLYNSAKQCALIAVDEIIDLCEFDVASDVENKRFMAKLNYWDEVKQEIEKL